MSDKKEQDNLTPQQLLVLELLGCMDDKALSMDETVKLANLALKYRARGYRKGMLVGFVSSVCGVILGIILGAML